MTFSCHILNCQIMLYYIVTLSVTTHATIKVPWNSTDNTKLPNHAVFHRYTKCQNTCHTIKVPLNRTANTDLPNHAVLYWYTKCHQTCHTIKVTWKGTASLTVTVTMNVTLNITLKVTTTSRTILLLHYHLNSVYCKLFKRNVL